MSPARAETPIRAQRTWRVERADTVSLESLDDLFADVSVRTELRHPLATLLAQRNLYDSAAMRRFLDPGDRTLHDPGLLPDAAGLIARLRTAGADGEPVLVVGDFDADGLTGAAIIIRALRAIGAVAEGFIPSRDADGHGIPEGALDAATEDGVELLIAVDCGTADTERVAQALDKGILVGIIDHHAVPDDPAKATWLVNPNRRDAAYPFPHLAGSGLAFKIAQGILADHPDRREILGELSVLAMIGGIADMVPVADEFRVIVRSALKVLNGRGRTPLGVRALLTVARAEGPYRVDVVGYTLAPRINAAGRIGDARPALELLTTDDEAEAVERAAELERLNEERRERSREAIDAARGTLSAESTGALDLSRGGVLPGLVFVRGDWSPGVIGLVAGRLAEEYARPALVGSVPDGAEDAALVRCSIRAPRGYSVASALGSIGDRLDRHGGHDGAGGCAFPLGRWNDVTTALASRFGAQRELGEPLLTVDLEPAVGIRSLEALAALVDYLAPTGQGNPDPLFLFRSVPLEQVRLVGDGRHARLTITIDGQRTEAIAFGRPDAAGHDGARIDLVARIVQRTFNRAPKTELHIVDLRTAEVPE